MTNNHLKKCLIKALRKAKPILLELGLPAYSAHYLVLAHKLETTRCKNPDIKVAHEIIQQEATEVLLSEINEIITDPRKRKALEPFYP